MGIERLIDSLNERMALPFDIMITFKECDGPEAFYDDETHEITLSYDLIADYYGIFSVAIRNGAKRDQAVRGAVAFTFFHELGHALIDAWKLPITGKEEDAADQLATLILIEEIEGGEQMALDGALALKTYAELESGEEKAYWDEHSLDEQRFYDILCMLYGHDPEKYAYLVKDRSLPLARAELCNEAYAKFKASWQTLLSPHAGILQNAASKIRMR
jgi:Putative metallopeptidase